MEGTVAIAWEDDHGNHSEVRGAWRDVSENGAGVFSLHPIPSGSLVNLRDRNSGARSSGSIRHVTQVGPGFRVGFSVNSVIRFRYN